MSVSDGESGEVKIVLGSVLDIRAASGLHRELLDRRGTPLRVDGAEVERIGGQCAAVLLSAARSWAADGQPFVLEGASPALREGLELLGLDVRDIGGQQTEH